MYKYEQCIHIKSQGKGAILSLNSLKFKMLKNVNSYKKDRTGPC